MPANPYPRVASFKTAGAFRAHLSRNRIALDFVDELAAPAESPLAQPIEADGVRIGNRFAILPMEGWDGTTGGEPTELTRRRWRHFGSSGAKLIWGGEAVAVRHDGRANPNQLMLRPHTQRAIASLRDDLIRAHRETFGSNADGDLFVGLQLTHSGRFSRPNVWNRPEPLAACAHPALDRRFVKPIHIVSDDELKRLVDEFVAASRLAADIGFQFVDVKHCHGYLAHELLGATNREGPYGGSQANRFRFAREVVDAIRAAVPGLRIGVRLSVFDLRPYRKDEDGHGVPEALPPNVSVPGFGALVDDKLDTALQESLDLVRSLDVRWICVTAGSPYYCAHVQRPAYFPPQDGYLPPEDPLVGVARQIRATAALKVNLPHVVIVGSAYSYLQEWLPHVAEHSVRHGWTDVVGLGRMALAYPALPADVLAGRKLRRESICRTFSDCTTGPRMGRVSGCYPLDPFYKTRPDAAEIQQVRTAMYAAPQKESLT
jgi:2,4-dienoyl-CoA reductase-like NADH-dependent reductase (Old Yellow Enzyme family)